MTQTIKNLPVIWETWVRSLSWEDPLEKGMTTYSSILAWRIPQTKKPEPGGLSPGGHKESHTTEWITFSTLLWTNNAFKGFPDGAVVKNLPANAGDAGSIPGSGRFPGVKNGNPLHFSCLEHSMDRGAWRATVHGLAKSRIWLSD